MNQKPLFPEIKNYRELFASSKNIYSMTPGKLPKFEQWKHGDKSMIEGFASSNLHHWFSVVPTGETLNAVKSNMLAVDYDRITFKITIRDDGTARVHARYGTILGSRLLAVIDSSTIPAHRHAPRTRNKDTGKMDFRGY